MFESSVASRRLQHLFLLLVALLLAEVCDRVELRRSAEIQTIQFDHYRAQKAGGAHLS